MARKSQEEEICNLILNELYEIEERKGVTFNNLFKKVKEKRGRFSYDTLSKYLTKMEQDGRIIRIIDVDSNRKIKPTLLYKNTELIRLRKEKINFSNILMDKRTKLYQFEKKKLKVSDLFPKFNEEILNFLETQMNLNINYLENDDIINWDILLDNFDLFLVERPEIKNKIGDLNDIILVIYLKLLEFLIKHGELEIPEIHYNLFFHLNFQKLLASVILKLTQIIQKKKLNMTKLFRGKIDVKQGSHFTEEEISKLLIEQLEGEVKKGVKSFIQMQKLEEFSEKYKKSLKMY
ncbi:MAG: hypothetical protein ACTSQI_18995 [Candidatus Helarchaeota archaeon]